jgi:NAD(P)-dependent dehydrogenase (short-subunit alcohol dehydrogenase family)
MSGETDPLHSTPHTAVKPLKVLVTGGGDSVGRVIAERFFLGGAQVHICDIRQDALRETLAANPGVTGTVGDIGSAQDVNRLIGEAKDHLGTINVLINNVGIGGPTKALEDVTDDEWSASLDVNVTGAFRLMRAVIPDMKTQGGGVVVNVSTGSTRTRLPRRTPYVVSKFALEGLTLNAARELGPYNIRCNAILPGMVNNERMRSIVAQRAEADGVSAADIERKYLQFISLRAKTEPSDVAEMAWFLASDRALRVTGELISVSGNVEWEG